MGNKNFLIIDSNSAIHRAFHALPQLRTKKGDPVNAVYGFLLVLFKAIKEFQPDYIAACFDFPAPTFRHQKFKEYKAKRPPTPKELAEQIPKIKNILNAFGVKIFEKKGFEADDLIGTIASNILQEKTESKIEIIILSGDLDCLQLINSQTKVYILKRGVKNTVLYDEHLFKRQYQGLSPARFIDLKALKGDPSDNIPGVMGIGEKTAVKLIKEFGTLENLYSALNQRPLPEAALISVNQRFRAKLEEQKEQAFLSYSLAEIKKDVSIDFNLGKCQWEKYDKRKVIQILKQFEFQTLIERLSKLKENSKTPLEIKKRSPQKNQLNLNF
jgi:DNA polymerase-1